MKGVITGKDVVVNAVTIVRLWGAGAWLQCAWAAMTRRPTTFLGTLGPVLRPAPAGVARAARPGAVLLAARVSTSRSAQGVLVVPASPERCARWRGSR
jgi:hypothetical protein